MAVAVAFGAGLRFATAVGRLLFGGGTSSSSSSEPKPAGDSDSLSDEFQLLRLQRFVGIRKFVNKPTPNLKLMKLLLFLANRRLLCCCLSRSHCLHSIGRPRRTSLGPSRQPSPRTVVRPFVLVVIIIVVVVVRTALLRVLVTDVSRGQPIVQVVIVGGGGRRAGALATRIDQVLALLVIRNSCHFRCCCGRRRRRQQLVGIGDGRASGRRVCGLIAARPRARGLRRRVAVRMVAVVSGFAGLF